jgi:hypothetical protein
MPSPYREGVTARASARRAAPSRAAEWDRVYRLPADLWRAFLADPATIERYHSKVYRRPGPGCWYWLGAISSAGHGRLRSGTRALEPERSAARVVASHVYGFQLSRGLLRPDPATGLLPVIRHRCDEASCHRPSHWVTGPAADNVADFTARGKVPGSPLTDRRGAAGRAIAIRGAILAGLDRGDSPARIEAAIWSAGAAGVPGGQARLFDWPAAGAKETT